jgi:DNA-binding XRE family transcriptional regulator
MAATKTRLTGPMSLRLRDARITAGLSRKGLAQLIGASERTVNYYESPAYGRARKSYIVRDWAEATGREVEELWGTKEQPLNRTGWFRAKAA